MLVCMAACGAAARAAEYYVDYSEGLDTSDGETPTTAWKHCPGDPAAAGVPAGTALSAGDTVHFKGGVTYDPAALLQQAKGKLGPASPEDAAWWKGNVRFATDRNRGIQ